MSEVESNNQIDVTPPARNGERSEPCLLVVIVNYRTAGLVVDALKSLEGELATLPDMRVVVTDNDSGDDSVEKLNAAVAEHRWHAWATIMPLQNNGGFSFGNNEAIRANLNSEKPADLVFLLNPDTVIHTGAVVSLVRFMQDRHRCGVVGALLEDENGAVQCSAHRMLSPLSELDNGARLGVVSRILGNHVSSIQTRSEPFECDWVSGAALMVRREVLETVGLLDEGYFLYFDEVDFCFRVKRTGWEVWVEPAARIMHLEGVATGIHSKKTRRGKYWYESRRRLFVKAYGLLGLIAADLLWGLGRLTLVTRRLLHLGGDTSSDPSWFAWDLLAGDVAAIFSGKLPKRLRRSGDV